MSELKKEWYVVNTYAGQENRVKENLERRVKTMGLEDSLFKIVVAEEKEIENKNTDLVNYLAQKYRQNKQFCIDESCMGICFCGFWYFSYLYAGA